MDRVTALVVDWYPGSSTTMTYWPGVRPGKIASPNTFVVAVWVPKDTFAPTRKAPEEESVTMTTVGELGGGDGGDGDD